MSPDNLLVVAMVVFALLLVGLVLTVLEFKNVNRRDNESQQNNKAKSVADKQ